MTKEELTKRYNLNGQIVNVQLDHLHSNMYPWQGSSRDVLITQEYPTFLVGTVLPHKALKGSYDVKSYNITIHKHDIKTGAMVLNGGAIR